MLVECNKIISEDGEDLGDNSPWLSVSKKYLVYAVRKRKNYDQRVEILIESEDHGDPRFFDISQFKILDNKIPSNWVADFDECDCFTFMPKSWFYKGFWDALEAGMPEVVELFDKEKELSKQNT